MEMTAVSAPRGGPPVGRKDAAREVDLLQQRTLG